MNTYRNPRLALVASAILALTCAAPATLASAQGLNLGVTAAAATASDLYVLGTATPSTALDTDTAAVELGMKFVPKYSGTVTGIRFYKGGSSNSGTHTGRLWSSTGTQLGQVTFSAETTSGWQTAKFATPIAVTAGKTYVVSYLAPKGRYSSTTKYFAASQSSTYFTTPANAGVYVYTSTAKFPTSTYQASNYFVDVVFNQAVATPTPTPTTPTPTPTPTTPTPTPTPTTPTPTPTTPAPTATTTTPSATTAWARGLAWYQANTGVPAGTSLVASGPITVTVDGTVIDGKDVNGSITVSARNVTVRNSRVRGPIVNNLDAWDQGLLIEHVEVDVSGLAIGASQKYAIDSFWGTTVRYVKAHGMSQGIAFAGYVTVEDSYFYGLRSNGTHSEAILSNGDDTVRGGNSTIARNWLDADGSQASYYVSGALCMYGDFGQIKNIKVDGNYLTGAGYLLYAGAVSTKAYPMPANVVVTNNVFDPKEYGPVYPSTLDPQSTAAWANNTLVNGTKIPAPTGNN